MGLDRGIRLQSGSQYPSPYAQAAKNGCAAVSEPYVGLDPIGDELRIAGVPRLPKSPFELNVVFFFEPLRLGLVGRVEGLPNCRAPERIANILRNVPAIPPDASSALQMRSR